MTGLQTPLISQKTAALLLTILSGLTVAACSRQADAPYVANVEIPTGDPLWSEVSDTKCISGCRCPSRPTRDAVMIEVKSRPNHRILVSAETGYARGWWRYTEDPNRTVAVRTAAREAISATEAALQLPMVVKEVTSPDRPRTDRCGYFYADQSLPFGDVIRLHEASAALGFNEVVWLVAEADY